MAQVAFTDFSGLSNYGKGDIPCRTKFWVHTPALLNDSHHVIEHRFMWNGAFAEVRIEVYQKKRGWHATLDVNYPPFMREPSSAFAEYLLNQSLDVLAIRFASSFQCVIQGLPEDLPLESDEGYGVGAIITVNDLDQAVRMGALLFTFEETLLKALSWYRRGISTADPVLGFLAIWNSLETVSAKFHEKSEKTTGKSKKQIFQLLSDHLSKSGSQYFNPKSDDLWNWIEASYELRLDIAHGLRALDPSSNEKLRQAIPRLKSVVTAILRVMIDLRYKENKMIPTQEPNGGK